MADIKPPTSSSETRVEKINESLRDVYRTVVDITETMITSLGAAINALTADTIADADTMPFYDDSGADGNKITWSNIKATLKTYFDTLYQAAGSYVTTARTISTTAPLSGGGDLSADRTLSLTPLTQIASTAFTGGSPNIDFTSIPATYSALVFVMEGLSTTSAVGGRPQARYSVNNGSSYNSGASDYCNARNGAVPSDGTLIELATGAGSASSVTYDGVVIIFGYTLSKIKICQWLLRSSEAADNGAGFCLLNTTSDIDAFRFLTASGNWDAGTITLYGMA